MARRSHNLGPNHALIGQSGGRALLNTPALVLDIDLLERNITAMADFGRRAGVALRPHAKTHKSAQIARLQIDAGAIGLCCAKLGEAEALADAGLNSIMITTPVVGIQAIKRLATLSCRCDGLSIVADSPCNVLEIAAMSDIRGLTVFVDVDPGLHRTGVADIDGAIAVARAITASPNMRFGGVQFFSGPSQHIESYSARRIDVEHRTRYLSSVVEALQAAGLPPRVITGGGTGTHDLDAQLGVMTELQVGSYVFMDDQYLACELYPGRAKPFEMALSLDTRVVSANWPDMVTVDAGLKATTGSPSPPSVIRGAASGAIYEYRGDEHGAILLPDRSVPPRLGDVVTLAAPHCDPTVNLHDFYHIVRGDTLIDIWPITARGRSA